MSRARARSATIPLPALVLGGGGVIPFATAAAMVWLAPEAWRPLAWWSLQSYGAIILSFVGAIHWGIALEYSGGDALQWRMMGWSVVPALFAWATLWLNPQLAVLLLLLGFATQGGVDVRTQAVGRIPAWYLRLRLLLTGGVCLFLGLALAKLL